MKQHPFVITAAVAVLVVVAALATLGVLSALAGQSAGLEKSGRGDCPTLGAGATRAVTDPAYGTHLAALARCSH